MRYRTQTKVTGSTDPQRLVWYGLCTYWTDDWDQVASAGGVPCCPSCRTPGFYMEACRWYMGIYKFALHDEGYDEFMEGLKERCCGLGVSTGQVWKALQAEGD